MTIANAATYLRIYMICYFSVGYTELFNVHGLECYSTNRTKNFMLSYENHEFKNYFRGKTYMFSIIIKSRGATMSQSRNNITFPLCFLTLSIYLFIIFL